MLKYKIPQIVTLTPKNGCFFLKEKQPFFIYLKVRLYLWSEFITDSGQCRKVMSTNTASYFSKTCARYKAISSFAISCVALRTRLLVLFHASPPSFESLTRSLSPGAV